MQRSQGMQIQDAHLPETKQRNINYYYYLCCILQSVFDKKLFSGTRRFVT